jgi:hypothetical protein
MTHAAPPIDYSSATPVEYEDYPEGRGEPRYAQKRSRRPRRSSTRKKTKAVPHCGIGARRNHRIDW